MDLIGKTVIFVSSEGIYDKGKISNINSNDSSELIFNIETEDGDMHKGVRVNDLLNIYKD